LSRWVIYLVVYIIPALALVEAGIIAGGVIMDGNWGNDIMRFLIGAAIVIGAIGTGAGILIGWLIWGR